MIDENTDSKVLKYQNRITIENGQITKQEFHEVDPKERSKYESSQKSEKIPKTMNM